VRKNRFLEKLWQWVARFFHQGDLDSSTFQQLESKKYKKSGGDYYA